MRAILIASVCLLTGCLARPPLDKQTFIFAQPPHSAGKTDSGSRVLRIRSLQVAAPFASRAFVYRSGESSYDRDTYAEFMVPPADGLISPICSGLRESGAFSAVTEGGSALKADTLVEIHVGELYGDFRRAENPAAVLTMRFVFFDAQNNLPGKVLLQREYTQAVSVKARTADALIEGWNQALAQIVDTAARDFSAVEAGGPKP
jgi:ABC-type uncharacterized transport system auxiliary subunit